MPVISTFFGIIISMYYLDTKQHSLPHIHVSFAEFSAVFSLPDGLLLEGELPTNKSKLVLAWIEIRKEELMKDWELAVSGNKVLK